MEKFNYIIVNKEGLHARPAGEILKKAGEFASSAELFAKGQTVSLKGGILALMGLGLRAGDELDFTFKGPDEKEACAAVSALIKELL